MTSHGSKRIAVGIFVIFIGTIALGLVAGLGIMDVAVLSIVGGGVFYSAMRLIDRPPTKLPPLR
jgi:hypothetical protein